MTESTTEVVIIVAVDKLNILQKLPFKYQYFYRLTDPCFTSRAFVYVSINKHGGVMTLLAIFEKTNFKKWNVLEK